MDLPGPNPGGPAVGAEQVEVRDLEPVSTDWDGTEPWERMRGRTGAAAEDGGPPRRVKLGAQGVTPADVACLEGLARHLTRLHGRDVHVHLVRRRSAAVRAGRELFCCWCTQRRGEPGLVLSLLLSMRTCPRHACRVAKTPSPWCVLVAACARVRVPQVTPGPELGSSPEFGALLALVAGPVAALQCPRLTLFGNNSGSVWGRGGRGAAWEAEDVRRLAGALPACVKHLRLRGLLFSAGAWEALLGALCTLSSVQVGVRGALPGVQSLSKLRLRKDAEE